MHAPTDDPDFDATTAGFLCMTPSARRPCADEMVREGLLTQEQADLIIRMAQEADRPGN